MDTIDQVRIRDRLAGQHILVTGSTGFLAKAFVEKLLRSVPTIASIHLLVRQRPGGTTPGQRVERDVLGSHVFDRLRALYGEKFKAMCDDKIHVVGGDLTEYHLGLDDEAYQELAARITLVVNSAATVTFDEQLDLAVELNSLGPTRLLQFARDCGHVPFMHVSTCYVCGARGGNIVEDFSAPEPAREKLPRLAGSGEFDLDGLISNLKAKASEIRKNAGAETDECRRALIDEGMNQARSFGWNDTYTLTKWIGEQLLVRDHGDVPVTIFRPAIIESSYDEPSPGWIDGLRMADPLIVAYGKGKLSEFPARSGIALDLIPVDFVANAMIATLPVGGEKSDEVALYQSASSGRHPLNIDHLCRMLTHAFLTRPMNDDAGKPIRVSTLRLVGVDSFTKKLEGKQKSVNRLRKFLERFHSARVKVRRLSSLSRQIEQLIYFSKIYAPYTHLDGRFADDALHKRFESLHPDDRDEFNFDVTRIDWDDYVVNRHVPGVRSFVLRTASEPSARIRAFERMEHSEKKAGEETLAASSLFEVFHRASRLFPDKTLFQIRRNHRWIRYSYDEALRASGTIMKRLQEKGVQAGDRVALCGESCPEWGLVYLGLMRAGMTAVPLDPQLTPSDIWSSLRFAEAKLLLVSPSLLESVIKERKPGDPEAVAFSEPFVPPPAASLDELPAAIPTTEDAVASILFTSGTTVAPKAVVLTHKNLIANASALVLVHPVYPTDQFLSVLPMYHALEFTGGFVVPMAGGATITYVDKLKGPEIRAAMQATGTTVMLVVPRLVRMFYDSVMGQVASAGLIKRSMFRILGVLSDLSGKRLARNLFQSVHKAFGGHLRLLVSGGSSLDPEHFEAFARMGIPVCEGYGLTETSPVITVNPPDRAKAGAVGPVLPNVKVEIRNQNLEGIGEIWVQGPSVFSEYLKNTEATERVLQNGWLRTGDLGKLDHLEYLYITGRSTDLIVTDAGKNVYPDEVEHCYRGLPLVKEFCVFGMPIRGGIGDAVHAVVVPDWNDAPDLDRSSLEREIRLGAESISLTLPSHQRIARLHFWDRDLPKTSTLKAKRNVIRDAVLLEEGLGPKGGDANREGVGDAENSAPDAVLVDNPEAFTAIRTILESYRSRAKEAVRKSSHLLLDLGIDSIGKIEVLSSVEACFGMRIDDDKAADVSRVSDLLNLVGERKPKEHVGKGLASRARRFVPKPSQKVSSNGHVPAAIAPIRWLTRGGVSVFMNTYVRVHAKGRENLPASGAFILAPNHSSHLDSPATVVAVGGKRRVWIAGAEDYFFDTAIKRFLFGRMFDTIAVDRRADGILGLRRCCSALDRGDGLLIFPEGTRSLTGELQPFKTGIAVLAVERQVPIVPVHIDRTYALFPKGHRFIRPGTVEVCFGKPVHPPKLADDADRFLAFRALAEEVERSVVALRAGAAK